MILSIDGGKRVGYALFEQGGEEVKRGVIDFDDFFESEYLYVTPNGYLEFFYEGRNYRIYQLVVEGFRHDPTVKQGGSLHWASQIEGAVKMAGALSGTPVAVQYAGVALPVAKIFTGYKDPVTKTGNKKHLPDEDSAWLHGMYWLRSQGIV